MVVTVTVVVLPGATGLGLALQVVPVAGGSQLRLTFPVKPPDAAMLTGNMAGWPAFTVTLDTVGVNVKSTGGVTVTLKGAEVPAGEGSIT